MSVMKVVFIPLCLSFLWGCASQPNTLTDVNQSDRFYGQPILLEERARALAATFNGNPQDPQCINAEYYGYPSEYRVEHPLLTSMPMHTPSQLGLAGQATLLPLSPGDMISVEIENGEGFNGSYILDNAGLLTLPLLQPIQAAGKSPHALARDIELALVKAQVFLPETALVTARVLQLASIEVPVRGAVFQAGRVQINATNPYSKNDIRIAAQGDFTSKRLLSEAIRAAHGVRPDAKLDQVIVIRQGWQVQVDLTGIMTGNSVFDFPLIAGDEVIIPSTGCFQPNLVRPSQITPKGFRVFMSNLIDSSLSNAGAAVGRYSTNIPYGTRLLQAAISANCVGGKEWTNAPRRVVLASVHPVTQKTQVIERSVEELMRGANREAINPFVMPNDALACYDSDVTNFRDAARAVRDIFSPIALFF